MKKAFAVMSSDLSKWSDKNRPFWNCDVINNFFSFCMFLLTICESFKLKSFFHQKLLTIKFLTIFYWKRLQIYTSCYIIEHNFTGDKFHTLKLCIFMPNVIIFNVRKFHFDSIYISGVIKDLPSLGQF